MLLGLTIIGQVSGQLRDSPILRMILSSLGSEQVPLLAGEGVNADQQGACASMNQIIDDMPKTIPTAHVISSAGCESRRDHLHFTPAGYRELGNRYGAQMLSLLGYKIAEPK